MTTTNRRTLGSYVGLLVCFAGALGFGGVAQAQTEQLLALDGNKIVRYEYPNGKPIDHFVGNGATPMSDAYFMTYGPDGNLYVSDYGGARVYRVNGQTGQYIDTFVAQGAGGLNQPLGLAFEGNFLYVCSYIGDSVLQYNAINGTFVKNFILPGSGTLDGAYDIQFDKVGNVWVASTLNDKVLKYNAATGAFISEVIAPAGTTMDFPVGLLLDGQGNLFISALGANNIFTIPNGGTIKQLVAPGASGLNDPRDMTLSPEGWLLVANISANKVMGFDRTTGAFTGTFVFNSNGAGLGNGRSVLMVPQGVSNCYPDCDQNGVLDIDDFICFQTFYAIGC